MDEKGNPIEVSDPHAVELRAICDMNAGNTESTVRAITNLPKIFDQDLIHKEKFIAHDLDRHPNQAVTAFSLLYPNGSSHLALMEGEGPDFDEITEGDSLDAAPSWVPGPGRRLGS